MNPNLISFKDLQQWYGAKNPSKIIKLLDEDKISYSLKDGKPITTWYDVKTARQGGADVQIVKL